MLADLLQPAFIGCSIAGCFGVDYCRSLSQGLDTFILDLGKLAVLELVLQRVARCATSSAVLKSSTTALMSALAPGSVLAFASAAPPAKLSYRSPTVRWALQP